MKPTVKRFEIICGDAVEKTREMPSNSFDSLVTDPPSGIGFMGKEWDKNKGGRVPWIEWLTSVLTECHRTLKPGAYGVVWALPRTSHWTGTAIEQAGFEVRDVITHLFGSGFPKNAQSQLKPAAEFWFLCRKPLDGSTAHNIAEWGTGVLNIDLCRIGDGADRESGGKSGLTSNGGNSIGGSWNGGALERPTGGRWPANVIHDGSDEVMAGFPAAQGQQALVTGNEASKPFSGIVYGAMTGRPHVAAVPRIETETSAARFFYCAKPSGVERADNNHPTVKSLALMSYLCRLITPPQGHVLDPFCGSGTTIEAALSQGMSATGIEQNPDYCAYGRMRCEATTGQFSPRAFGGLFQEVEAA